MILFDPTPLVPQPFRKRFTVLRMAILLAFLGAVAFFSYRTFFPSQEFLFSFENPDTKKSTLEEPHASNGKSLKKGHITKNDTLRTYAGTVGSFSSVRVELTLERDSPRPRQDMDITFRKSYRSFFLPSGDPLSSVPKDRGFIADKNAYLFSDGKLFPFLSDRAALSWFPKGSILPANDDLLRIFPPEETTVGFRPGTLLSDHEGVYAIGGDDRAHPIGSTGIFEALGFDWGNVIPVDEEELRFHKRGGIYLFDAAQPDGTLFSDPKTGRTFVVEQGKKRLIEHREYLDSLRTLASPTTVSEAALEHPATCTLTKQTFALRPTYVCDLPISALREFPGGSFEMALSVPETIHAAVLDVTFKTEPDRENFSLFLRQIRERFDAVYGGK